MNKQVGIWVGVIIVIIIASFFLINNLSNSRDNDFESEIITGNQETLEISELQSQLISMGSIFSIDEITDERLNIYGEILAKWADKNHVTIEINRLPINYAGPNPGGPSSVYWKHPILNDKERYIQAGREFEVEFAENKLEEMRTNLRTIIEESGCDVRTLENAYKTLASDEDQNAISVKFLCLGSIEYKLIPVEFGEE